MTKAPEMNDKVKKIKKLLDSELVEYMPVVDKCVVSVVNDVKSIIFNDKHDKHDITTNTTLTFKDVFKDVTQPNKLKWILYVRELKTKENEVFVGLNYNQIITLLDLKNLNNATKIVERLKKSEDIKLNDKVNDKVNDKPFLKHYVLSKSTFSDITDTLKIALYNKIQEIKSQKEKDKISQNISEAIDKFRDLVENETKNNLIINKTTAAYIIDWKVLSKEEPELAELLLEEPEDIIKSFQVALEQFDSEDIKDKKVRVINLPNSQNIDIGNIRSKHLGKLWSIKGIIRKSSDVRPQATAAKFECPACGNTINIFQVDINFKEPARCSCGRKGKFKLISKELIDLQRVTISEAPEDIKENRQPKEINVFLSEDLCDIDFNKVIIPGHKIRVNGILEEIPITLRTGAISIRYDWVIKANSIESLEEIITTDFTEEEIEEFKKYSQKKDLYEDIPRNIAPHISGYKRIKLAGALHLVGGNEKILQDGTKKNGEISMAFIGEPGIAKTDVMMSIVNCSMRGKIVSSNTSVPGLIGAVVRDDFNKQGYVLETGALSLASGGSLGFDEADKSSDEVQNCLLGPMSNGTINISKANINTTIPIKTPIIMTLNPKNSRFDPYKPKLQQINIKPVLLDRLTLIFIIEDEIKRDPDVADAILNRKDRRQDGIKQLEKEKEQQRFFKKYFSYCKTFTPELTKKAKEKLKDLYITTRKESQNKETNAVSFSPRFLENIIKLSEASAKIRLSNKVEVEDVNRAFDLEYHFLETLCKDSQGNIDIDMISGVSSDERKSIKKIAEAYEKIKDKDGICNSLELLKESDIDSNNFNRCLKIMFNKKELDIKKIRGTR